MSTFHKDTVLALIDHDSSGKIYVRDWLNAVPPSKRVVAQRYAYNSLKRCSGSVADADVLEKFAQDIEFQARKDRLIE